MSDLGFNTEVVSGAKKNHDLTSRLTGNKRGAFLLVKNI